MNAHFIGRGRDGVREAFGVLRSSGTGLTGVGIDGDILYGPRQVRAMVDAALAAGVPATYRELASDKGHDASLV